MSQRPLFRPLRTVWYYTHGFVFVPLVRMCANCKSFLGNPFEVDSIGNMDTWVGFLQTASWVPPSAASAWRRRSSSRPSSMQLHGHGVDRDQTGSLRFRSRRSQEQRTMRRTRGVRSRLRGSRAHHRFDVVVERNQMQGTRSMRLRVDVHVASSTQHMSCVYVFGNVYNRTLPVVHAACSTTF